MHPIPAPVPCTLAEIAAHIGAEVPQSAQEQKTESTRFTDVKPLDTAQPEHVSFIASKVYLPQLPGTRAGVVVVSADLQEQVPPTALALVVKNPYLAFAQVLQLFYPTPELAAGISQQAVVSSHATLGEGVRLEPGVVVYADAHIGAGVHIMANTVIGPGVRVGAGTRVGPNVTLQSCTVGAGCLIHPGVRIGQDGFGFAQNGPAIVKIPQVGRVVIGDDVEIGANTTIDRGTLEDTVIADHAKIDCLVQIGHNVRVGQGARIVAQSGVAGSTKIGAGSVIGGQSGVAGHLELHPQTMLAGRSGLTKSTKAAGQVLAGFPALPIKDWKRLQALLARMAKASRILTEPQAQAIRAQNTQTTPNNPQHGDDTDTHTQPD